METILATDEGSTNPPYGPAPPGDAVSDALASASNHPSAPNAPTAAKPLDGPVVVAQSPVIGTSAAGPRSASAESGKEVETSKPALDVVKSAFTSAQAAVTSGYQTVSASTDEFAHESPWKSIAFAALGGIVIGMLIAR